MMHRHLIILLIAAVDAAEARIYSWMYALMPILIGGTVRRWRGNCGEHSS